MNFKEFEKVTINQFNGLYARGMADEVPKDHAIYCNDILFGKKGEMSGRFGTAPSLALGHPVKRFFLSTIGARLTPLTLDNSGNIYAGFSGSPLFSNASMIDFVALNVFNKTLVLPILNRSDPTVKLQIWDGVNPIRAIGFASPTGVFTATAWSLPSTRITVGLHKFAVSYITNTGYTTAPGPLVGGVFAPVLFTSAGDLQVKLDNLPIGPAGTVARQIFVTKSGLNLFYYLVTINDNTSVSTIIDFGDTDLAVSADKLFDLTTVIAGNGNGDIDKYHGRVIVFGGENDLVRVSNAGDAESFDNVTGYIQIPSENDGNVVAATFQISDNIYFTKMPGIYTVADNGGNPSSWNIIQIDGGCGAMGYGVSTITGSQPSLSINESCLLADLDGLFMFTGVVQRPPLTWKINDLWKSYVTLNTINKISVYINPFQERFYVAVAGNPVIMMGDYSQGWASDTIRWSLWTLPDNIQSISMSTIADDEFTYCLRVGYSSVNGLDKMHEGYYSDKGVPIMSRYRFPLMNFGEGNLGLFRGLRFRATRTGGTGTEDLNMKLFNEANSLVATPPKLLIDTLPDHDYFRQINFTGEKMSLEVDFSSPTSAMKIQRVDFFGKSQWRGRPG